VSQG